MNRRFFLTRADAHPVIAARIIFREADDDDDDDDDQSPGSSSPGSGSGSAPSQPAPPPAPPSDPVGPVYGPPEPTEPTPVPNQSPTGPEPSGAPDPVTAPAPDLPSLTMPDLTAPSSSQGFNLVDPSQLNFNGMTAGLGSDFGPEFGSLASIAGNIYQARYGDEFSVPNLFGMGAIQTIAQQAEFGAIGAAVLGTAGLVLGGPVGALALGDVGFDLGVLSAEVYQGFNDANAMATAMEALARDIESNLTALQTYLRSASNASPNPQPNTSPGFILK